jgi:hypothetical protein
MDTFDLKKYLAENPLTQPQEVYHVVKVTFPNNQVTFHARKGRETTNPQSFLNHFIKSALEREKQGVATSPIDLNIIKFKDRLDDIKIEKVDTFQNVKDATELRNKLTSNDPNALNQLIGVHNQNPQPTPSIQVKKSDTASHKGNLYLSNKVLQQYLKQGVKVDMNDKINPPSRGDMYKITSNVERVD